MESKTIEPVESDVPKTVLPITSETPSTKMEEKINDATLDCQDDIWNMLNPEIAYCCGYSQTKLITTVMLVIVLIYMAYTFYSTQTITIGQGIFLGIVIGAFFMLPNMIGKGMRGKWIEYSERMDHLMKNNPGMTRIQAKADISRTELAKETQRQIRQMSYRNRRLYR